MFARFHVLVIAEGKMNFYRYKKCEAQGWGVGGGGTPIYN